MPLPTTIDQLSTTAASNFPAGSDSPSSLDDVQRAHASFIAQLRDTPLANITSAASSRASLGSTAVGDAVFVATTPAAARTALGVAPRATRIDVASVAGTVDLTANAPDSDDIRITGSLTVTGFTVAVGRVIRVTAGGAFTLTNNANIVTQTGANIVAASGDTFMLQATAANVVEVLSYVAAAGVTIPNGSITPAKLSQPLTLGTAVATTSGTAIDFTGIPSWVKRITVMLRGVSTNGASTAVVQLGTTSGVETTGYTSSAETLGTTNAYSTFTAGFGINGNWGATITVEGAITMTQITTNTWVATGIINRTDASVYMGFSGGSKVTAGTLDRIRLTTVNGTDTFDAGSVNILYEG
jgi:hypothetical protein